VLFFVIALIAAAFALQKWSLKNAFTGFSYSNTTTKLFVEPDEEFELVSTLANESYRFVPYIKVYEALPGGSRVRGERELQREDVLGNKYWRIASAVDSETLRFGRAGAPARDGQKTVRHTLINEDKIGNKAWHVFSTWLLPRSKVERRLPMSLPARGQYFFLGANVSGGDFLGLEKRHASFHAASEIIVCPRRADAGGLSKMLGGFLGDVSVRRFIMEDPVLTVGAREYTGREPLKQISWGQSARVGKLMVRQFDYTVEPVVSVLLDVDARETEKGKRAALIEGCYSLARSVCEELEALGVPYDFITNATTGSAIAKWSYLPEGLGRAHFFSVLEGLGRASYVATEPFAATVAKIKMKHDASRSLIAVLPERDEGKRMLASERGGLACFVYGEDCKVEIPGGSEAPV